MSIPIHPVAEVSLLVDNVRAGFRTFVITPEVHRYHEDLFVMIPASAVPRRIEVRTSWTVPTEPEMLAEIRRLTAEIARLTPKVEAYRVMRQHVTKDGKLKNAYDEAHARRAADSLSSVRGGEYEGYECWCGSWHVGRLRTPKGDE